MVLAKKKPSFTRGAISLQYIHTIDRMTECSHISEWKPIETCLTRAIKTEWKPAVRSVTEPVKIIKTIWWCMT